jgi:hypothetical protein
MTNKKITDFTTGPALTGNEFFPIAIGDKNYKYDLNFISTWFSGKPTAYNFGALADDPTVSPFDGGPIPLGAQYYNTTLNAIRAFGDGGWFTPNLDAAIFALATGAQLVGTPEGTVQGALDGRVKTVDLIDDDGAELVGFLQSATGAAKRTQKSKNSDVVSAQDFNDLIGDGVVSASTVAQAVASLCDSGKKRYLYIPNWDGEFKWNTTVTFINPGVRIYGDQAGSYNRGTGKDGWLVGQTGLTRFFDLGASRTTGNPADNWQVDGISMKQAVGVTARTIDGIAFTSRTNGPDRGALVRGVSAIGLRDALTIENPDIATVLATLNIEGGVFQGNRSILNAKGMLFGLRMVGVQGEQNVPDAGMAVINGSINGPVTITDNMLEGQPRVFSFDIPPVTGNRPAVLFARNYLEANSGEYLGRFRCNATGASLEMGPNFISGTPTFSDYLLFESSTGGVTFLNNDPYPCTIKNSGLRIQYGSKPFNYRIRGYEIRQLSSASHTPEIVLSDFENLTDDASAWTHGLPAVGNTSMTPYGVQNTTPGGTNLAVPMVVTAGDLVCVNVLVRVSQSVAGSFAIYVRNESGVFLRGGGAATDLPTDLKGRWALVSLPFVAQAAATTVRVLMATISGTYPSAIAGVTVRNYGSFVNDGTTKVLIEPAMPNLSGPYLPAATTVTTTTTLTALSSGTQLANATGGAITMNLPAAASATGLIFNIKKIDASANAVTVDPSGAETIDGAATLALTAQWQSTKIQSNGTAWFVL